jgi:hypothetical protein
MLYLVNFTTGPFYVFVLLAILSFPVAVAKTGIALLQVSAYSRQLGEWGGGYVKMPVWGGNIKGVNK